MMHGYGIGVIELFIIMIIMFLLLGGVILLIVWLVRSTGRKSGSDSGRKEDFESPREILKKRYARGDITREEYKDMLSDLEK